MLHLFCQRKSKMDICFLQMSIFGFRRFISMLGVGKAAPAQFILRGKMNLRRTRAAGQKAGFVIEVKLPLTNPQSSDTI